MRNAYGEIVDHLFREEHGKMVAVLTRIFGFRQLDVVEDVVQDAYLSALRSWRVRLPENPRAWLMQTAKNRAIDLLRRGQLAIETNSPHDPASLAVAVNELFHDREIADSQLRLMFACCHPILDERDQIAFTLKLASGLSIREIGQALLTKQDTVKKRLQRVRKKIQQAGVRLDIPDGLDLGRRLQAVLTVLYLTFNEGYHTTSSDEVIRRDLCAEAIRLTKLVAEHRITDGPDSNALLALMCFHAARFDSRLGDDGRVILLADQDRNTWDRELINVGNHYFTRAGRFERTTVFVLEAAIAAQHCYADSYAETAWDRLFVLYNSLYLRKPTPVVMLNRIVVQAEMGHASEALAEISTLDESSLTGSQHLYHCVLSRIYEHLGDDRLRTLHLERALEHVEAETDRAVIRRKMAK